MPSTKQSLRITEDYRAKLSALTKGAQRQARSDWQRLEWNNLSSSYVPIGDAIAQAIERAQTEAVYLSAGYLGAFLTSELGERVTPPTVSPKTYVGKSFGGQPLRATLDKPLIAVLVAIREGQPNPLGLGLRSLMANVDLDVKQAARQMLIDEIAGDKRMAGFQRAIRGTCPVCESAAGDYGTIQFPVHPGCQCVNEPIVHTANNQNEKRLSGEQRFNTLSYAEQDQLLGPDVAQLLRDGRIKLTDVGTASKDGAFITNRPIADIVADAAERSPLGFRARAGRVLKDISPEKPPQPTADLDELFQRAEEGENKALQEFLDLGKGVQARLDADSLVAGPDVAFGERAAELTAESRPQVVIAPIKTKASALGKFKCRQDGYGAKDLTDVTRASILVRSADDIPGAVAKVRTYAEEQGWELFKAENGFVGKSASGYRDLSVLLRSPSGFVSELQFHVDPLWAAKFRGGHKLYEEWRRLKGLSRPLTGAEQSKLESLRRQMKKLYDDAWNQAKPTRGTKRITGELESWQRDGRRLFQEDLKIEGVHDSFESTALSIPEMNAANNYGSPKSYEIFQAAQRNPKQALKEIEQAVKQPAGERPEIPLTLTPSYASYGAGFQDIGKLGAAKTAVELERQANWLTYAIMRHGEVPTEPLIRMTAMDHLPKSVLDSLAAGETVELSDKGFLAATADVEVADMVAGITARGKPVRWNIHADGARALHTNDVDPTNHLIDEWIFPKGTRFTLKFLGRNLYEAHIID